VVVGAGRIAEAVPHIVTFPLTSVTASVTSLKSCWLKGRQPGDAGWCGKSGSRGRGLVTAAPRAAPGIMLTGTTTGPGGAFPGLGQAGAGNARVRAQGLRPPVGATAQDRTSCRVPRKPGLELRPRGESPDGKSRGGTPTGERAALSARAAPLAPAATRPPSPASGRREEVRRGGWYTRLSAFRFLFVL
jgi:hypothetical protein